jgi:hypothetical protein
MRLLANVDSIEEALPTVMEAQHSENASDYFIPRSSNTGPLDTKFSTVPGGHRSYEKSK